LKRRGKDGTKEEEKGWKQGRRAREGGIKSRVKCEVLERGAKVRIGFYDN
jgi:hypothetical protein